MRTIKKGAVDQSVVIRIVDSTDGTPETAVTSATAGLALEYRREGATSTALTESDLAAVDSAHSDGGMKHIGNGYYRVDLPDAAVATGSNGVLVHGTATGMVVIGCYIHLVDYDPQDTVRMGLTALPNAAAEAAGGLFTRGTGAGQLNQTTNGELGVVSLVNTLTTYTSNTPQTGDSYAIVNSGVHGNAAIKGYVDDIGVAGAGLTDLGGMSTTMKAQVQTEAEEALVAKNLDSLVTITGAVNDAGATTTQFISNLSSATDNFYKDLRLIFTSGALAGVSRVITSYVGSTKTVVFDEALTSAPANSVTFDIVSLHAHSETQIATSVWANSGRTLTGLGFSLAAGDFAANTFTDTKFATGAFAKVWSESTRTLSATGLDAVTAWTVNITGNLSGSVGSVTGNVGGNVVGSVGSINGVTFPTNFSLLAIDAAGRITVGAFLSTLDLTATMKASVNTEVDSALDSAIPGTPTANSINERIATLDDSYTATRAGYIDELAAANIPADLDQVKADLPSRVTKNAALAGFMFYMVDSTDHVTGKTGLTITATRSLDGAAFAACANAATEVSNGWYKIDLAAADLNANVVALKFTGTGADARMITIITQP